MTKNEPELIVRRTQVVSKVGVTSAAKRASYPCWILSVGLAITFSAPAWAQAQLATLSGTITDSSGAVIPGASVTIVNQGSGLKRSALTDTVGEFCFVGSEVYNLFNHPNFGVPSNTQSRLVMGGNGDAIFKYAAGNFADNVGRILITSGTGRQIQLAGRFTF